MSDSGDLSFEAAGGAYQPSPALAQFATAVARFVAAVEAPRHPADLGADLRFLRHVQDEVELNYARRAAAFAATDEYDRQGSHSAADWIRHECKTSGVAASSAVTVGEQLASLPASERALHEGRIGYAHLAMLASTAAAVREVEPDKAFDETELLGKAEAHSVGRFRHDCAHARHRADATGFLAEHLSEIEWRSFEILPCEGGAIIRGRLDTVGAATLRTALEPLARRAGPEDQRRRKRRSADGLIELAEFTLNAGTLPAQGGERPHLAVTATIDTLVGRQGAPAGELEFSTPIPAATVQRLACDAGVRRVVFGPESAVIDVGRALRVPSAPMRRALHVRDKGCVWPGCDRPPSWTNAHHVAHWARDDGQTEIPNLVLLCYRHHWLVHEGGWSVVRTDDGRVLKIPPPQHAARPRGPSPPTADEEEWRERYRVGGELDPFRPAPSRPAAGSRDVPPG